MPEQKFLMSREPRLDWARQQGLKTQSPYERVVDEIATVRLLKVQQYGEGMYEQRFDLDTTMILVFADIHRKFIRIENIITKKDLRSASNFEALREAFLDLANYGLMGAQLLDQEVDPDERPYVEEPPRGG